MTKKDLDPNNPFNWRLRTEPSIFAKDLYFRTKSDGKSDSQRSSEVAATRRKNGNDPVDLYALGQSQRSRQEKLLAYKHFGAYAKATPSIKHPNKHEK